MSRALPNCALCGETLKHKGRSILKWPTKTGRPMIGWCESCNWGATDPELLRLKPDGVAAASDASQVDSVLAAIAQRGPGRVSWSRPPEPHP